MNHRKKPEPISFDEAKELWDSLASNADLDIESLTEQEKKEFHRKLYARIEAHEATQSKRRKIIRYSSLMVAATIALICSIVAYKSLYLPDEYQAHQNDMVITLKDGSKVTLSKGAKLSIEKSFPADTRDVFLEGNAVFNVTKSKIHPFIVHGNGYETKVLGTVFKISQIGKTFTVDLYEGKVQVTKVENPKETFVVHPKETFSNLGSKDIATIVATKKVSRLSENNTASISFTDLRLFDAIKLIEQTYGIEIKYPSSLANVKITATMLDATAAQVVKAISLQQNLNTKKINENTFQLEE